MMVAIPLAVRGALRQANNALRWAPLLPLWIMESDLPAAGRPERISTFLLCCAAPQIVGYLLELEHSGRLDQMRLAGQSPSRVATRVAITAGGPWIAGGVALLAWSLLNGEPMNPPVFTAALVGAPTMIAAGFTHTAAVRIDPRILIVGLGFLGAGFGIVGQGEIGTTTPAVARLAPYVLFAETVMIAAWLRGVMRRIAFPPTTAAKVGTAFQYRPAFLRRAPAMYRGAVLAASGYALGIVFSPAIAIVRAIVTDPDGISITPFLLPPLVIGGIVISLICREDAVLGRLDVVRQSSMTPASTALQMIAGLWLPFVLATVSLAIVASTMFTLNPRELTVLVAPLLILAPLPVVEGWSRTWVLMFSLPYILAVLMHARSSGWVPTTALVALLWLAAVQRMRDSDAVVISKWPTVVVATLLGAWPWLSATDITLKMLTLGSGLLAVSPLLVPVRYSARRDFWVSQAVITIAAVAAATASMGLREGVAAGLTTGLIWLIAVRVHQSTVIAPLAQALIRFGCILLIAVFIEMEVTRRVGSYDSWRMVALALFLLVFIEGSLRARAWAKRPATPRA